jgi:hypothetical protein
MLRPGFEPGASKIQIRSITPLGNLLNAQRPTKINWKELPESCNSMPVILVKRKALACLSHLLRMQWAWEWISVTSCCRLTQTALRL